MEQSKTREQLIRLLYLVCRNHFLYEDSGIIEHLDKWGIKNKADLKVLSDQMLKVLSQELINIMRAYITGLPPSKKLNDHFTIFYKPLIHLLKDIPVK